MSVGVGASSGPGIGSDEEKPSICQRTIESSWQARERIRSPWKATLGGGVSSRASPLGKGVKRLRVCEEDMCAYQSTRLLWISEEEKCGYWNTKGTSRCSAGNSGSAHCRVLGRGLIVRTRQ